MKYTKYLLTAILIISSFSVSAHGIRLETFVDGLNGPYDMAFDNGDMIVTVNDLLIKVKSSEGQDEDGVFPISTLTSISGDALGGVRVGGDFYVLRYNDQSLLRVSHDGTIDVIAEGFGVELIEMARHGDDFIVTDLGIPGVQTGRLLRVSQDGQVSTIAEGFIGIAGIEVVGDTLWATDFILGNLYQIDLDGTVTVIAQGLGHPVGIEYDGTDFIIADFGDGIDGIANGRILRVSKQGEVKKISRGEAHNVGNPGDIVILGADIYFSDLIAGRISRLKCGLCKSYSAQ